MSLPLSPPLPPMEARLEAELPSGHWLYEPKWDGFRCLVEAGGAGSFDDLLQRIHPAESRVRRLASETPATLRVFDLSCAPGGPSRWAGERSAQWEPVEPRLVCEVRYDHVTSGRFRHGAKFLRWRPDKPPKQCTFDQIKTRRKR